MNKRVTIMIDDEVDKKLRIIQAKEIQSTSSSVSYSGTINKVLKNNLKK
jgi:predicted transcriptional regulator